MLDFKLVSRTPGAAARSKTRLQAGSQAKLRVGKNLQAGIYPKRVKLATTI